MAIATPQARLSWVHSPDGWWWWDGNRWLPAVSPDGSHWFDGTTWRPRVPPRPRPSPALIALLVVGVVGLCIVGLVGSMMLYVWASGEAHDARSLDDSQIWEAARIGCLGVTQAVDGAGDDRRARVVDGNAAIGELVRGIEALGASKLADDDPALDWLADWQRLAAARAAHADRLGENATGLFQIPQTDDGFPITRRMIDVSPPECKLAVALASQP